ncbi:unnamed protein product, partial [Rotaria magnacalcarata]
KALENVLEPFNHSTKILSTRHRPTLSICQSVIDALTNFLTLADDTPLTLQDLLKKQLLLNLNFCFDKHVSDEQQNAMLVSSEEFYEKEKKINSVHYLTQRKVNIAILNY